jgi:hypothetical protein
MRNNIPDILNKMVESLKGASIFVGSDLLFLEREPEQITNHEEGSEFVFITNNYKIEFVTKIFVFRDFKPYFALSTRTDIRKFLPLLYSNNLESGINPKHFIFQFFGDAGFWSDDERLPSDLPDFYNGDDSWIWGPPLQNPLRNTVNVMIHYRHCPNCNSNFPVNHPLQKYCDGSCRRMMYVKHRRKKLLEKEDRGKILEVNCEYCGGIFETNKKHAKYCGPRCRIAAYRKRKEKGLVIFPALPASAIVPL